jgi:hypothetical protein
MANENFKPDLNQPVPNGPAKTYPWLTTVSPENPSGYIKLFPTATNDSKYLQFAVETGGSGGSSGGKISWRVIDEQGNVRRQFNSVQQLADSGYNFGFDINATNITLIKNKLADTLQQYDADLISGAQNPSSYFTGQIPGRPVQPPPAGAGAQSGTNPGPSSSGVGTTFDVGNYADNPLNNLISQFDDPNSFEGIKKFLYYPSNIGASGQDKITISQISYIPGDVVNALTGTLGNRELDFNTQAKEKTLGTVILPIPNEISEANQTAWGEDSLSSISAALMSKALPAVASIASGEVGATLGNLQKAATTLGNPTITNRLKQFLTVNAAASVLKLGNINVNPEAYISRVTGTAINPNLELLFNGPKLRQFGFQFKLTPRDEKEARNIRSIIKFFKKGMAPRRSTKQELSIFLGAPNVFRIKFTSGETGRELDSVGKIKTCALQSFSANYTPDGFYAAYKDPSAGGSQPIAVVINLGFAELTPIFNDEYDGDSPSVGPEFVQEKAKGFNVDQQKSTTQPPAANPPETPVQRARRLSANNPLGGIAPSSPSSSLNPNNPSL